MIKQYNRGSAVTDLVWLIGLMIILFVAWIFTGGPDRNTSSSPFLNSTIISSSDSDSDSQDVELIDETPGGQTLKIEGRTYIKSPFFGEISISKGSAESENRPGREYIILEADRNLDNPINISGWRLENGDAFKKFEVSGNISTGTTDVAFIPNGINIFLQNASNPVLVPIILNEGDEAVVVSGGFSDFGDIKINYSFRTNVCTGYIEDLDDYDFRPSLDTDCPDPVEEPGVYGLTDNCFEFVEDIDECHTPDTDPYRDGDDYITNHVDGDTDLSRSCREFIVETYSYSSCVSSHISDDDFLGDEWRVFLNRSWEMWKDRREVISLFDTSGRLVDQITY